MRTGKVGALQLRSRSDRIVDALIESRPTVHRKGFARAVRSRWPGEDDLHQEAAGIIPDAFEFHEDIETLTLIEAVDTNPIRAHKAELIGRLTLALGDVDWELTVVVYDNCGNLVCEVPGYAFLSINVERFAPRGAIDVLPAAMAFYREECRLEGGRPSASHPTRSTPRTLPA